MNNVNNEQNGNIFFFELKMNEIAYHICIMISIIWMLYVLMIFSSIAVEQNYVQLLKVPRCVRVCIYMFVRVCVRERELVCV